MFTKFLLGITLAGSALATGATVSAGDYARAAKTCKLYDFDAGRWLPYSAARA